MAPWQLLFNLRDLARPEFTEQNKRIQRGIARRLFDLFHAALVILNRSHERLAKTKTHLAGAARAAAAKRRVFDQAERGKNPFKQIHVVDAQAINFIEGEDHLEVKE